MSTCMNRLSGIITLAKSKKVTEYKKGIKQLLEFWEDISDTALEQIREYSRDPSSSNRYDIYSWNEIFTVVHELFMTEIERISKLSGNSGKLDKERITKLLYFTTDKANLFLKPKNVATSTLSLLVIENSHIYSEFYEVYLGIFRKYVLRQRSQRILVPASLWQELLKSCIAILKNHIPNVDYPKLVETIELIVRHGCVLSPLLFETKQLLPIIEKLLENYESYNIKSTDVLFKLTSTVCQQIATDSRIVLCKFSENMPLSLLDQKSIEEKYKLYLIAIQVHHPNGAILGDDFTYVHDEEKWKAILNLLYKMILNDIRPMKLSNNFVSLACEVFRQKTFTKLPSSLTQSSIFYDTACIQPRKKRRMSNDPLQERWIEFISDRDPERAWPFIQIATILYKKYPDCLKFEDYIEFLEIIIKLMGQAYKHFSIMESLCELAAVFVQNEQRFEKDDLRIYWDKVWDSALRYLSISHNEIVEKGCILVQNLIFYNKITNPNSLLKLYLTKSLQWSSFSIEMLEVFCRNIIIPTEVPDCDTNSTQLTNNSIKLQLLQWTLHTLSRRLPKPLSIENFSRMLIGFTLKFWYKPEESVFQDNFCEDIFLKLERHSDYEGSLVTKEDIERCYLSFDLKTDLPFNKIDESTKQDPKKKRVDNPYSADDLDFLLNSLLQIVQTDGSHKDLGTFIMKTALLAKVISDLKAMDMIQCNFDEFCLVKEFCVCLKKISDQIENINWSKSVKSTLEITKAIIILYKTKYDKFINEIILNSTSFPILKKIYDISKLNVDEFDPEDKTPFCRINTIVILALYSCINAGEEMSDVQLKLTSTLLKLPKYSLSSKSDIVCITEILKIYSDIPNNMVTDDFIELFMCFVKDLFDGWQNDDEVTSCMLQLLPKMLDKIMFINDKTNMHNVLLICKLYHDQFVKGSFGQKTHLSLVQCLDNVVKHKAFNNSEVDVLNVEVFITFVTSSYYLVRLESLKYVYSIFSSKEIDYNKKVDFYDKLEKAVYNIFFIQRDLTDDEIQEEKFLRSVSVMQILATIICSKSIFQSPALFTLARTIVERSIDADIVKKGLDVIKSSEASSKNIIEENLNYLLTTWCQESSLDVFPYFLLNCSTESEFHNRYVQMIFPVLIREGKINEARFLCDELGTSFEQVFKRCCSNIIPWALPDSSADVLKQLQENSGNFEGSGNLSTLIKENLLSILVHIVQRLHDLNHFYSTFETTINLPKSDPPHFKKEVVDQCFDQLIKIVCQGSQQTVFYFIITRKPSTIQKILLQLVRNIYDCKIDEYKAKAFHQYVYFCSKIIEELKESYCDETSTYFVRDIGCTLLNLIKQDGGFIAKLACRYLYKFLNSILPERSAQVENIVSLCVKTLTPLVRNPNETSAAKNVLVLLLKEHKQFLMDAIDNLGSLPNFLKSEDDPNSEFQVLRECITHFLKTTDDKSCSVDSLLDMKKHLTTKKSELEDLYEELESSQGFAEHCAASLLHRLIYRLIKLTESDDSTIALQAAKCLGILGPADLSTMILHPQETQARESLDPVDTLTLKVCETLADLVVSSDIELRKVSSEALYIVTEYECRGNSKFLKEFLYTFSCGQKNQIPSNKMNIRVDAKTFERIFDQENSLWSDESNCPYNTWIADMTSAVANCLTGLYSKSLVPVFKLNVPFCEITLPRLVSLIVHADRKLAKKVCYCVNRFFNYHFCQERNEDQTLCDMQQRMQGCKAQDAIRCMLNVVNHLRIQTSEHISLDFDYLPIAMAAQFCSAYFSSVLYAELWCRSNLKSARDFDSIPIIDQIYELDNNLGKIIQDILKEAYMKIGDSDSLYGCGSSHLQNRRSRIPYYTNFHKLDKMILSHDVDLSVGSLSSRGMVHALRESSLHYLAKKLMSVTPMQLDSMDDLCYDSLWRLSDWSQITNLRSSQPEKKNNDFSTYHYESLKCLHENDNSSLKTYLEQAHYCIIKDLSNISLESCKAVYPKLSQLQMLREIEELSSTDPRDYQTLLSNWENEKYICNNNFQYIEPLLTQRAVMFNIREPIKNSPVIRNALISIQLKTARLAQDQGDLNRAARALESLAKQSDLDEETENCLLYNEARLAWMRKDEDIARFNLRSLIKKKNIKPNLLARTLRVYGNWIAENKSENPQAIISKYYEKAITAYSSLDQLTSDDLSDQCKARAALGQFAHEQYLMITEYMKSPQFESLLECLNYSRNAVIRSVKSNTDKDIAKAVTINTRQTSIDSIEVENIQRDRAMYLQLAVMNYLSTLQNSDEHDSLIFRLVSLWLANMYDEEVNKLLEIRLSRIPSYKFIALVPQLAPHMSNVGDIFTRKIGQVLERCAKEHPHHTLPVLLALKNLYNDSKYCNKKNTKLEPRVLGAQQLIQQLLSTDIRPIIQEMDRLSDSLVMLAYYEPDKKKASSAKVAIPRNLSLNDIRDFQHSLVPTMTIDIKKNCTYTNIVSVRKYESSYGNVGGINAPKKIMCVGTDGVTRPQLVKGRDDLRQDAVMQQVFTVMNSLLKSNKDAKQRKLHVRTYKVVPLTQRSGVLQWCENTLPLSMILTGDGPRDVGLHRKYYPDNYTPMECRKKLQAAKPQQKFSVFVECCKNLPPAFHYFFTENYLSPEMWFERRLAYTRSVATTSMIGYILGLGDRHVSNILLDKSTAEVIHIDFGIAFEQGKVLPTPETVPFRLTRDMEIAMGVSGVEGTMRRCCEETMTVLREQREIIVTLLRVLLYDPLYSWAITPAKAATYQSEHSTRASDNKDSNSPAGTIETNKLAERALLRVQQKLQGIEEGVASSIAGQVERLIQQARDPANLCRLFEGWQAYL